jgi:hypothetical protein
MILTELKYLNSEQTVIQAKKEDGVYITIEQEYDIYELFDRCVSGEFGEISDELIVNLPTPLSEIEIYRNSLECSRLQAKAILYQYGLLAQVESIIETSDFLVKLAWAEAQVFKRNSPLINSLKTQLTWEDETPITDEQLDQLFKEAKEIEF